MGACDIDNASIIQTLRDANCDEATVNKFLLLKDEGRMSEAIRLLSCHRCELLNALHEAQKPIHILDYLINKLRKSQQI